MKPIQLRLRQDQPVTYQIKVQGRLEEKWSTYFGHMTIATQSDEQGPTITTLTGAVADQAALHGLLSRIRDLGLLLLSVQCLEGQNLSNF